MGWSFLDAAVLRREVVEGEQRIPVLAQGLEGDEPDNRLVPLMAEHPTLLKRPIGNNG